MNVKKQKTKLAMELSHNILKKLASFDHVSSSQVSDSLQTRIVLQNDDYKNATISIGQLHPKQSL